MKPAKPALLHDFPSIPWEKVQGGGSDGRAKKGVTTDGRTVRILDISPRWNEQDWCRREHIGYVVSGRIRLDFAEQERMSVGRGQGFSIPQGCAHKATCGRATRLFLVG